LWWLFIVEDGPPCCRSAFNDVRVERTLREELRPLHLSRRVGEDIDEGLPDELPFCLGIDDPLQFGKKPLGGIHDSEIDRIIIGKHGVYFLHFSLSQKAIVYKNSLHPVSDGAVYQCRRNRGVHSAGKSADYVMISHKGFDSFYRFIDEPVHRPSAPAGGNVEQEVSDDVRASRCVHDLRVKLYPVYLLSLLAIAAMGHAGVPASVRNPSGAFVT